MKITARCLAAFAPLLAPADLAVSADRPGTGRSFAGAETPLDSLFRFEGALAWECGAPRSSAPHPGLDWARDAWLAGWDHADARFYHAGAGPDVRGAA